MKSRTSKIIVHLTLAAVLAASCLSCSGGGGSGLPPFQGGIEVVTYLFDSSTNQNLAQMGVGVTGQLAMTDAGSCSPNGTTQVFGGTTNGKGDIRCPSCQVHAVWDLTINYNLVTGACQPNLQQIPIDFPCGGAVQPVQCVL
jgi:hypothetical protein